MELSEINSLELRKQANLIPYHRPFGSYSGYQIRNHLAFNICNNWCFEKFIKLTMS